MKIALLQLYSATPAPDYHEMASALRSKGHTVWVATPSRGGELEWSDGSRVVAVQRGPETSAGRIFEMPILRGIVWRLGYIRFLRRVREFLASSSFDIVQVNPHGYDGLLVRGLPGEICCVLDVRQAGEVAGRGVRGAGGGGARSGISNCGPG
jgi:hypothetical protein